MAEGRSPEQGHEQISFPSPDGGCSRLHVRVRSGDDRLRDHGGGGGDRSLADLPTGVVTFLLTDIEASSRAWEEGRRPNGSPGRPSLRDPRGRGCDRWGGVRPRRARARATPSSPRSPEHPHGPPPRWRGQRRLTGPSWVTHSGCGLPCTRARRSSTTRATTFGQTVIRCARLRSCGHGGQILVGFGATADLVGDHLPEGASLRDLGDHRLKDLDRAEHVYELCHPNLPRSRPSRPPLPRHAPPEPPRQMTPLIGRDDEITTVLAMVEHEPIVTLTGTGGCGKSRLAGRGRVPAGRRALPGRRVVVRAGAPPGGHRRGPGRGRRHPHRRVARSPSRPRCSTTWHRTAGSC